MKKILKKWIEFVSDEDNQKLIFLHILFFILFLFSIFAIIAIIKIL